MEHFGLRGKIGFGIEFHIVLGHSLVEVLSVNPLIRQMIVTGGVPEVFLLGGFSSGTGSRWRLQCFSSCNFS